MPLCSHGLDIPESSCDFLASHYTNRKMSPGQVIGDFLRVSLDMSYRCRSTLPHLLDETYGNGPHEKIDYFGTSRLGAPFFVFVHGGLWMEGSKSMSCYFVEELVKRGCVVAVVGYDLCPNVTLDEIVDQIVRAISTVSKRGTWNDSEGLWLCGHSAGAHLVALALARLDVTVLARVRSAFLLSGIYDVTSNIYDDLGEKLGLDEDSALFLSPLTHAEWIATRCRHVEIHLVYGNDESEFYKSQSEKFYAALLEWKKPKSVLTKSVMLNTDHFSLILQFSQPHHRIEYQLTSMILNSICPTGKKSSKTDMKPSEPAKILIRRTTTNF